MAPGPSINRPMGATEWFLLITLSVLWGGAFFCSEVALDEVQPSTLVLGRVGIAALASAGDGACLRTPHAARSFAVGSRSWSWARSTIWSRSA